MATFEIFASCVVAAEAASASQPQDAGRTRGAGPRKDDRPSQPFGR